MRSDFVIRPFRKEDDEQCKALEGAAMQRGRCAFVSKLLLKAKSTHYKRFDSKAGQYEVTETVFFSFHGLIHFIGLHAGPCLVASLKITHFIFP